MKALRIPLGLGLVQPLLHLLHLFGVLRSITVPLRGRSVIVLPAPQEDEAGAIEIEFVNQPLWGHAELFEIRHRRQYAVDRWIAPHLVIADADEPSPAQPRSA